jgi:hypothetical protein
MRDGKLVVSEAPGLLQLIDRQAIRKVWDGNALYISRDRIRWDDDPRLVWADRAPLLAMAAIAVVALLTYPRRSVNAARLFSWRAMLASIHRRRQLIAVTLIAVLVGVSTHFLRNLGNTAAVTAAQMRPPERSGGVAAVSDHALVADPQIVVLRRTGVEEQKSLRGTVRIRNSGTLTASVSEVRSSCSCLTFENIVGREITPGSMCEFRIEVGIPREGAVVQTLTVTARDGLGAANVTVTVPDGDAVPRVLQRSVRRAQFTHAGQQHFISFVTVEAEGSSPWITGIRCSPPEFLVDDGLQVENTERRGYILRTYSANLRWSPLSRDELRRERYGEAIATAVDGASSNEIPMAALVAYGSHPCRPSVVALGTERRQEVVVCGNADDGSEWTILDESRAPKWLAVKMRDVAGRRLLDVGVGPLPAVPSKVEFVLRLQDKQGRIVGLPVVLDP